MSNWTLTIDHPASSYGQPILLVNGKAYGPCDIIDYDPLHWTAAKWVAENFGRWDRDQYALAIKFCGLVGIDISLKAYTPPKNNLLDEIYGRAVQPQPSEHA